MFLIAFHAPSSSLEGSIGWTTHTLDSHPLTGSQPYIRQWVPPPIHEEMKMKCFEKECKSRIYTSPYTCLFWASMTVTWENGKGMIHLITNHEWDTLNNDPMGGVSERVVPAPASMGAAAASHGLCCVHLYLSRPLAHILQCKPHTPAAAAAAAIMLLLSCILHFPLCFPSPTLLYSQTKHMWLCEGFAGSRKLLDLYLQLQTLQTHNASLIFRLTRHTAAIYN